MRTSRPPTPFLSLPPEIRLEILRVCISTSTFSSLHLTLPITRTCRTLHHESLQLFDNHALPFPTINRLCLFLERIGRARRAQLHSLAFKYCTDSGIAMGQLNWEEIELVQQTFKLLKRECKALAELEVHVCKRTMKKRLLPWNDWEEHKDPWAESKILRVFGMRELGRLRGLKVVKFVEYGGLPEAETEGLGKEVLEKLAERMMAQPGEKVAGKQVGTEAGSIGELKGK